MPMFFLSWHVRNISHADDLLARFRGNDAFACSDKQHLIAAMDMHLVSGAGAEIDDGEVKIVALRVPVVPVVQAVPNTWSDWNGWNP